MGTDRKFPSSQQLKEVHTSLFEGVGGNSKGEAIPGVVLPTIPVGEFEFEGLGDMSAIILDVHYWATKLVALQQCEGTTGNDGIVQFHISRSANNIWGYLHKYGGLLTWSFQAQDATGTFIIN